MPVRRRYCCIWITLAGWLASDRMLWWRCILGQCCFARFTILMRLCLWQRQNSFTLICNRGHWSWNCRAIRSCLIVVATVSRSAGLFVLKHGPARTATIDAVYSSNTSILSSQVKGTKLRQLLSARPNVNACISFFSLEGFKTFLFILFASASQTDGKWEI